MIQDERDEDYYGVKKLLGEKSKFIPLILQLIVCEDSYYWCYKLISFGKYF